MNSPTSATETREKVSSSPQRPCPPPDLARFLADGDELLDGERLCWCDHLDGDHEIGEGGCSRCHCTEFVSAPPEAA